MTKPSCLLAAVVSLALASNARAQSNPTYVQFSPAAVKGALYKPDAGPAPHVAVLLIHAHPGVAVNGLRSLNPAVLNEADPKQIDPALDPFDPKNGFNPNGPSKYSEEFKQKYFKAQADRMNRLIAGAHGKLQRMQTDNDAFPDDDVFLVIRGEGARLMELDPAIHHSTLKPQKLLKNDGTVVTQIVESVRRA